MVRTIIINDCDGNGSIDCGDCDGDGEVSCDNVVDLVLLKALMDERRMFCEGLVILVVIIVMVMVKEDVHV
jgi:hypothetical protein